MSKNAPARGISQQCRDCFGEIMRVVGDHDRRVGFKGQAAQCCAGAYHCAAGTERLKHLDFDSGIDPKRTNEDVGANKRWQYGLDLTDRINVPRDFSSRAQFGRHSSPDKGQSRCRENLSHTRPDVLYKAPCTVQGWRPGIVAYENNVIRWSLMSRHFRGETGQMVGSIGEHRYG